MTTALHTLEVMELIRNTRGCIGIRNRARLEELASDAYGTPEAEYERVIGPIRKRVPPREQLAQTNDSVVPFSRDGPQA